MIFLNKLQGNTLHHLNSALMIVSLAVAFYIPFELFLFSYAVLGPLHYLTEINWLYQRNFFTLKKNDFLFLTALCIVGTWINFFPTRNAFAAIAFILLYSLYLSVLFVFVKNNIVRILLSLAGCILFYRLNQIQHFQLFVGLYLPTIIHVLIFTWLFMIYGVLKEPSRAGWISLAVLIFCVIIIFLIPSTELNHPVSSYVKNAMGPFALVNASLVNLFGLGPLPQTDLIYENASGFTVMRFIAFAYTYHYLNWFSKTSVIQWHKTERNKMIVIIVLWLVSLAFYAADYMLGMQVLFFLSFLHVFLEFPLNVVSIKGIYSLGVKKLLAR